MCDSNKNLEKQECEMCETNTLASDNIETNEANNNNTERTIVIHTSANKRKTFLRKVFEIMKSNKIVKKIFWGFIATLIIIISTAIVTMILINGDKEEPPTLDVEHLSAFLVKESKLTSASLKIRNIAKYEDDGIWFINKGGFVMQYDATLYAGIDMSKVNVASINEEKRLITISIPKAEIQTIVIDHDSLVFYDEKFSLLNPDEKEDLSKALSLAEEEAWAFAPTTGILSFADDHAKYLIENMFDGNIYDYQIVFKENK